MRSDNSQVYGTISRTLHWAMAICFGFMLYTGLQGKRFVSGCLITNLLEQF